MRFVFFGTPEIAVYVLDELEKAGYLPSLVVTNPDAPKGRKMVLTSPPVKEWAMKHNIEVLQPETLKDASIETTLRSDAFDLFVVAAYGKLIPRNILEIPKHGTLNVHPSLLPELRGASPIRSAILRDMRETGVTIMLMDEQLDHGPILAQEKVRIEENVWPLSGTEFDELLARKGGVLLSEIIPRWMRGEIVPQEQEHERATFCTKITKEMGELDLQADPYQNLLKIKAFTGWPGTHFFTYKNGKQVRIKVLDAELSEDGSLRITRIIPEGKNEMSYEDFKLKS